MNIPKDFDFSKRESEASVEAEVEAWASANGWISRKMCYVSRRSCPDRFFFGYGQILAIEFKRLKNGKPSARSEGQTKEHARLSAVGVQVPVFYTSDSAIAYLKSKM